MGAPIPQSETTIGQSLVLVSGRDQMDGLKSRFQHEAMDKKVAGSSLGGPSLGGPGLGGLENAVEIVHLRWYLER
jgi:hypothetical protein